VQNVEKGLAALQPAIKESEERIVSKVINGVVQQIEARGMEVGTVTREGMEHSINAQLQTHLSPGKAIPSGPLLVCCFLSSLVVLFYRWALLSSASSSSPSSLTWLVMELLRSLGANRGPPPTQ
jgi:hypothetical protein